MMGKLRYLVPMMVLLFMAAGCAPHIALEWVTPTPVPIELAPGPSATPDLSAAVQRAVDATLTAVSQEPVVQAPMATRGPTQPDTATTTRTPTRPPTDTLPPTGRATQAEATVALGPASTPAKGTKVVEFPDKNLEAAVRKAISKPAGPITAADLATVGTLDARMGQIRDLHGLEYCINLTLLDLDSNEIVDLTPLAGLTSLTSLDLTFNDIADLAPLSGHTSLRELDLGANPITNLSPLAELSNLTNLNLSFVGSSVDLTPLARLTGLRELDLHLNQIVDVTPLAELAGLSKLDLGSNQISDLTALTGPMGLTELDLSSNQVSDLTPLTRFTGLSDLNLASNQVSDLTPLAGLLGLHWLHIESNTISDLTPLVTNSQNGGLGDGDTVWLQGNNLDPRPGSDDIADIGTLREKGIQVYGLP